MSPSLPRVTYPCHVSFRRYWWSLDRVEVVGSRLITLVGVVLMVLGAGVTLLTGGAGH